MVIGAYALAFHARPRATEDLDVWIASDADNVARLGRALREFGFAPEESTYEHLAVKKGMLRLGRPPLRIEILTTISGRDWEPCHQRRTMQVLDGVPVPVICLEDFRENKRASGRPKDLADLALLEEFGEDRS